MCWTGRCEGRSTYYEATTHEPIYQLWLAGSSHVLMGHSEAVMAVAWSPRHEHLLATVRTAAASSSSRCSVQLMLHGRPSTKQLTLLVRAGFEGLDGAAVGRAAVGHDGLPDQLRPAPGPHGREGGGAPGRAVAAGQGA